ncbi:MAG: S46 family peptidase [Ignavibacteria bacterium]|nr:MAG: S46 family peptidase [Ignavibacteria bacterium]
MKQFLLSLIIVIGFVTITNAQSSSSWFDLDTVKAGKFDTGKMWTFEYPPIDYFEKEYRFTPDEDWFDHVRMAALKFATYCSASFVSEDGLVMTNHHCARRSVTLVTLEGEDLHENGFISYILEDERLVPGLFVDQLVYIQDVTDEIQDAMDEGKTEDEKLAFKSKIVEEIETRVAEEKGLEVSITPLYEGGRYSLYGYKRYNNVRLVFAPEEQLGSFGGDPDNFTYPRYNLDFSFFRVYDDDGEPLKTDHYYEWSDNGAEVNEPVFVVSNPGSTNRLKTVAQLEYSRDITYPRTLELIKGLIETYESLLESDSERELELKDRLLNFLNSQKAYTGMLKGLRDPILMQRKRDFENNFKSAVQSDEELNEMYGDLWEKIAKIRSELSKISNKRFALRMSRFTTPRYFFIAEELINIAEELKKPESERDELYVGEELDLSIESMMPEDFDYEMNKKLLKQKIQILSENLGDYDELLQKMTGGKTGDEAVDYILSNSSLTNADDMKELVAEGPDAILSGNDPFIYFILTTKETSEELNAKVDELTDLEDTYNEKIGRALFEVYGTSIPPDATFTLRISDGVVKSFPYNGTTAPAYTTFYGMYDRYYSFNKEFPWSLPERWENPPEEFDLSTKFNFITTNDLTGGSSGSAIINKNAEVVGISFDGNIQGLPGNFIFRTEENRAVGVHSTGIMEVLEKIYNLNRISEELKSGEMVR